MHIQTPKDAINQKTNQILGKLDGRKFIFLMEIGKSIIQQLNLNQANTLTNCPANRTLRFVHTKPEPSLKILPHEGPTADFEKKITYTDYGFTK